MGHDVNHIVHADAPQPPLRLYVLVCQVPRFSIR